MSFVDAIGTTMATALATRTADVFAKNAPSFLYDRIVAIKQKRNDTETIIALEEIINALLADKNDLIQIIRSYEQEFIAQKISDEEFEFITKKLIPLAKSLMQLSGQADETISSIEETVSPEMFKILQVLGFNYKEAIGVPLTNLVAQLIQTQTNKISGGRNMYPILDLLISLRPCKSLLCLFF